MFKNKPTMEVTGAENRVHTYTCPADTPKAEAYYILGTMRDHLFSQIKADHEAEKAKEEEEGKEPVKEECLEGCETKEEESNG